MVMIDTGFFVHSLPRFIVIQLTISTSTISPKYRLGYLRSQILNRNWISGDDPGVKSKSWHNGFQQVLCVTQQSTVIKLWLKANRLRWSNCCYKNPNFLSGLSVCEIGQSDDWSRLWRKIDQERKYINMRNNLKYEIGHLYFLIQRDCFRLLKLFGYNVHII